MTEESEELAEAPEVEPAAPEAAPAEDGDSLESLLSEYETGTAKPEASPEPASESPQDIADYYAARDGELSQLRDTVGVLLETQLTQREEADQKEAFAQAAETVSDFDGLPDDYGEAWLRKEYMTNPELNQAWENRHRDDASRAHCQSQVRKAMKRLREAASRVPDAEASANRTAMTHAVRRAAKAPPEQPEVDRQAVAEMSDAEFEKWTKSQDTRRK